MHSVEIKILAGTSVSEIAAAFHKAFRDYFIQLQFTEEGMAAKMKSEGMRKEYSVGAFAGNRPVGFMLHGFELVNGKKTLLIFNH